MAKYKARRSGGLKFRGKTRGGNKQKTTYKPFKKQGANKSSSKRKEIWYTPTRGKNKGRRMKAIITETISIRRLTKKSR